MDVKDAAVRCRTSKFTCGPKDLEILGLATALDVPMCAREQQGATRVIAMPHLGIFWRVPHDGGFTLLTDKMPISESESYGACLTHPSGHAEAWERWRALAGRERRRLGTPDAVMMNDYDAFPRGRIVADEAGERFTIYADRKLYAAPWPAQIVEAFALDPLRCVLMTDAHYRTP